jgi:hypothetical protein
LPHRRYSTFAPRLGSSRALNPADCTEPVGALDRVAPLCYPETETAERRPPQIGRAAGQELSAAACTGSRLGQRGGSGGKAAVTD